LTLCVPQYVGTRLDRKALHLSLHSVLVNPALGTICSQVRMLKNPDFQANTWILRTLDLTQTFE